MSQYFIESKQTVFLSFNQIVQNEETDFEFELLIENIEENFGKEQQASWLKFWNKQGEEQVLESWNEKYKDYLKVEEDFQIYNQTNCSETKDVDIVEIPSIETDETDVVRKEKSWEDLWQEHREQIYSEQYLIFSTVYYNYFLYLKKSFVTTHSISEEEEQEEEEKEENIKLDSFKLIKEQLQILGLPTAFGGRSSNLSDISNHIRKSSIHYSDFFSDSEMEHENEESDGEDHEEISNFEIKASEECALHNVQRKSTSKVKKVKRNRKLKNVPSFILEEKGLVKYWRKRFSLFSRFDEGIRLDRESWFSVTPEKVAKHLAERLKCCIIVDGFCGSGGNVIQFAFTCDKVIGIDIDPIKLEMAKHNAEIYKVSHKIEFILGDFMQLANSGKLKGDIIFLSPPWGGPKYKNKKEFDIEKYLQPAKASEVVEVSRKVSQNIALFLPRNSNVKQIVKLAGAGRRCEIEHNYLDSRLVAITALYGEEILTQTAIK